MVDKIAEKVAKEKNDKPQALHIDNVYMYDHVEEERLADLARERQRELAQMEMFDDPYMNWSGHR